MGLISKPRLTKHIKYPPWKWYLKTRTIIQIKLKNNDTIFSTNTGRSAEYYTGLVFEIYKKSRNLNLASGGRYDNLMQTLGSKTKVAAIGGAINYDNILKLWVN